MKICWNSVEFKKLLLFPTDLKGNRDEKGKDKWDFRRRIPKLPKKSRPFVAYGDFPNGWNALRTNRLGFELRWNSIVFKKLF